MAVDATTAVGSNSVTGAIRKAAQATGTSFDYLLATARVESDLNPNLTMRSSTATGLFQFIEQTWLGTLKQAGPAFGYGDYANAISQSASGRYVVADPALRNEIMQLRKDPAANALMGGVFTQQNAAVLARRLGRTPSEGELYIGHFFGPYAGAKAIALTRSNPTANAAEVFPAAAAANRPIFYDKQGNARSVAGVCAELTRRYEVARAGTGDRICAQSAAPDHADPKPYPNPGGERAATSGAVAGSHDGRLGRSHGLCQRYEYGAGIIAGCRARAR
jgi:Transglycosylase SLT domain